MVKVVKGAGNSESPRADTKSLRKNSKSPATETKSPSKDAKIPNQISKGASQFTIKIENVVAFTSLNISISLNKLVNTVENTEYEPEQFPGLVYRPTNPKSAALIFSSGKIVCTGTKSIEMAKEAMTKVVNKIKESGVKVPDKYSIHVENIVASARIKADINLEDIAFSLEDAEYEPEQFPGLVYRIKDPRVAFLLFTSGKIICTGAQSVDDIHEALGKFKVKLEGIGVKVKPVAE